MLNVLARTNFTAISLSVAELSQSISVRTIGLMDWPSGHHGLVGAAFKNNEKRMPLNLPDLNDGTRALMADEVTREAQTGFRFSNWLTPVGQRDWERTIRNAIVCGNDATLAKDLGNGERLHKVVNYAAPRGGMTNFPLPQNAAEILAETEFNRYYACAICRLAIERGLDSVVVYRAKDVLRPRPDTRPLIGRHLDPALIIRRLEGAFDVVTALGLHTGPVSYLSVKLPPPADSGTR